MSVLKMQCFVFLANWENNEGDTSWTVWGFVIL